jgi:hypothetical protein
MTAPIPTGIIAWRSVRHARPRRGPCGAARVLDRGRPGAPVGWVGHIPVRVVQRRARQRHQGWAARHCTAAHGRDSRDADGLELVARASS